jgi:hypothetical protein
MFRLAELRQNYKANGFSVDLPGINAPEATLFWFVSKTTGQGVI